MNIYQLVVLIVVAGLALYVVNTFVPMEARMKQLLNVVVGLAVAVVALFWLLAFLGVNMPHRL